MPTTSCVSPETVARNKHLHCLAPDVVAATGTRLVPDGSIKLLALRDFLGNDPLELSEEQRLKLRELSERWDELTRALSEASVYHHRKLLKGARQDLAGDFSEDNRSRLRSMRIDPWLVRQEKAAVKAARNQYHAQVVAPFFRSLFEIAAVRLDKAIVATRKADRASAVRLGVKALEASPTMLSLQRLRLFVFWWIENLGNPTPVGQESPIGLAKELGLSSV